MFSAGTVLIMSVWGEGSGSAMQALHFGFPIGALLGSLLAVPFVSSEETKDNSTLSHDLLDNSYPDNSQIETAFAIVGACAAVVALAHILLHFVKIPQSMLHERKNSPWKDLIHPGKWADGDSMFGLAVLILLTLFYVFQMATMKGVLTYIVTYAVDSDLDFTNAEAALLNAVMNGCGGIGRAVFIPVAHYLSVTGVLMLCVHGQFITAVLMTVVGTRYKLGLWITSSMHAFIRDPTFPCGYVWANYYILLLAFAIGVTNIATTLADSVMNILIGYLYTNTVIESIFYLSVLFGGLVVLDVYVMYSLTRNRQGRLKERTTRLVDSEKTDITLEVTHM